MGCLMCLGAAPIHSSVPQLRYVKYDGTYTSIDTSMLWQTIGSWEFSPLGVGVAYQWLFVLYSSAVLLAGFAFMTAFLHRDDPKHRAASVYQCICTLACDPKITAARQALHQWKAKVLALVSYAPPSNLKPPGTRVPVWRSALFYIFHLPVLMVASLPAIGFVSLFLTAHCFDLVRDRSWRRMSQRVPPL